MELDGQTAMVTGGSRNIGRSIAIAMAERGADVGVAARDDDAGCEETAAAVEATGSDAAVALGDIGDPEEVVRIVERIRESLGSLDVLVNNAAVRPQAAFLDVSTEEFDRVTNVNFRGVYQTTQAVVPDMIEGDGGAVVNIFGLFAHTGLPGFSHAFSAKAGAAGLVRQLAAELGPDGIRVNGVAPGSIDTIEEGEAEHDDVERQIVEATPLQRQGEPREIADACCFLASDAASFVTGQMLHVNGGLHPSPRIIDPRP